MKRRARIIILCGIPALMVWIILRPERPSDDREEKSPTPAVVAEQTVRPPAPPAESTALALPPPPIQARPRDDGTRAAIRRDLTNPLVPPSFQETRNGLLAAEDSPIAGEMDQVALMFRDYRTVTGENPVGTNAEIMKSIMGGNPKGAMLGPPEGQSVNGGGELVDRWGHPYFFHQLTSDLMEIRSAGPDGILWNEDDILSN